MHSIVVLLSLTLFLAGTKGLGIVRGGGGGASEPPPHCTNSAPRHRSEKRKKFDSSSKVLSKLIGSCFPRSKLRSPEVTEGQILQKFAYFTR